jgi:hypothetical protein
MNKLTSIGAAVILACGVSQAFAQQTAPMAPDPATVQISPAPCEQPPTEYPQRARDSQAEYARGHNQWVKSLNEYKTCMSTYWTDLAARAKSFNTVAIKINDAQIAAVKTYNDFIDKVKAAEGKEDE